MRRRVGPIQAGSLGELAAGPPRRDRGRPPQGLLKVNPELVARVADPKVALAPLARLLGITRIPRQVTGSWRTGRGIVADNPRRRELLTRLAELVGVEGPAFKRDIFW